MTDAIAERAKRGAELMDKLRPGWANRINVQILDMNSCSRCILGQLYKDYFEGLKRTFGTEGFNPFSSHLEENYGFLADYRITGGMSAKNTEYYELLAEAWKEEINKRLEAKPAE